MIIEICKIVGVHCSQRLNEHGTIGGVTIRELIEENWAKESQITISFQDVLTATSGFIDEAIGKLAFAHSLEELKAKLTFVNINDIFQERINRNIDLRLRQAADEAKKLG